MHDHEDCVSQLERSVPIRKQGLKTLVDFLIRIETALVRWGGSKSENRYLKRLPGRTDVEDAVQWLYALRQEENIRQTRNNAIRHDKNMTDDLKCTE
jgi:hypothetical protein